MKIYIAIDSRGFYEARAFYSLDSAIACIMTWCYESMPLKEGEKEIKEIEKYGCGSRYYIENPSIE
jgi:hypothetical protein